MWVLMKARSNLSDSQSSESPSGWNSLDQLSQEAWGENERKKTVSGSCIPTGQLMERLRKLLRSR
jgi:hypothetical protein